MNNPPFTITESLLNLSIQIAEILGSINTLRIERPSVELRKANKIKTIHSSLSIEGNTLSLSQVTDLIDEVPVLGPSQDIIEVKNAIAVYRDLHGYSYQSITAFKKAHKGLLKGLAPDAGNFRSGNVGVFAGSKVSHVAPPAKRVSELVDHLFSYMKSKDETSLLIKGCIFHYEIEFIHPFSDGNGRMGRLWQQVILMHYHPVFEYLPIESLIKENQADYYRVLGECDVAGESTQFIEFSLGLIAKALSDYQNQVTYVPNTPEERVQFALQHFKNNWFTRLDYLKLHKVISPSTASRDLSDAVKKHLIVKSGDKRVTRYKKKE